MRALKRRENNDLDVAAGRSRPRLVLPRVLRRPFRMLSRIEWRPSRHAGLQFSLAVLLVTGIAGVVMGGHVGELLSYVTAKGGLAITEVKISGQTETSEFDVLTKLDINTDSSLATFDVDAARARIETLPWVQHAALRKLYPATLEIRVLERTAFALWRHGEQISIIDKDGAVITDAIDPRYAELPMVVGEGAAPHAAEIFAMLDAEPSLRPKVHAAVLIAERRWNVLLDGGVEILLPEANPAAALHQVATLDAESGLLSRDIVRVDLRIPDRMVLRLTDDGVVAREKLLKEQEKVTKPGGPA